MIPTLILIEPVLLVTKEKENRSNSIHTLNFSSHSAKDMSTDAKIFRNNSMIDKPKEIHNQVMGEHNPENSPKPKTCVDQGIDPTNECEKCGKQFKWRRQLMDHRRLVHAARDHKCTLCEKLFLSK